MDESDQTPPIGEDSETTTTDTDTSANANTPADTTKKEVEGNTEGEAKTAQDPKKGEEKPPQPFWQNPLLWVLALVWLWVWWSWQKNKKKQAAAKDKEQDLLKKGNVVVTIGRMHGTIVDFDDTTVTIKPDPKRELTMTFDRNAIYKYIDQEKKDATDANGAS